ncbi:Hypothetical predicted protein [Paramuricea clavata]|uniref:Uncharacterized protein n=1 Tax=Paramuricea clavata TaxID=317549 RepID=A0A7D9DQV2_PARCT|nr:Hypothetical predicted protein [Paramuricea clavata]
MSRLNQLERQVADGITKQEACEALMGLHALTGRDTVSAFPSKGKLQPMQMLIKNHIYVKTMKDIGKEWSVNDDTFSATEEFVCHLYGRKGTSVDSLRYELCYAKGGKVTPEALPPCQSSLWLHVSRANYIRLLSGGELQKRVLISLLRMSMAGMQALPF